MWRKWEPPGTWRRIEPMRVIKAYFNGKGRATAVLIYGRCSKK